MESHNDPTEMNTRMMMAYRNGAWTCRTSFYMEDSSRHVPGNHYQFHQIRSNRSTPKDRYGTVCGASKKRTVTVRRVIIFLNISRRPLLICLQSCLHQYKTLKAVATAKAAIVLRTPAMNLKKVFLGFLVVSPLFNHFLG